MKKINKLMVLALSVSFMFSLNAFAKSNFNYSTPVSAQDESNLSGYAVYVPSGVTTSAVLTDEINSQSAIVGQSIKAILVDDFIYNETLIAPKDSVINGVIVQNKKAGFANRNAQVQVKFTTITTPYNQTIPINANIMTEDNSGILKGGTKKDAAVDYTKNVALGAGSGAALGTAMGALSSGSVGKGAVYGTALGAGIGLLKGVADKGDNVLIPSNSQINIYFTQPITLNSQY